MTEQQLSQSNTAENPNEPVADVWRNEVQSRIARYKTRRGRRIEGAFSMRFPFPVEEQVERVTAGEAVSPIAGVQEETLEATSTEEGATKWLRVDALPDTNVAVPLEEPADTNEKVITESIPPLELIAEPDPEPFVDSIPRPRPKRKVIAFPRQLSVAPETAYRLADPVTSESPRILDVPEELEAIPTTPFLDGLQLDPVNWADTSRDREHVELPFRAVRVAQRVFAGLVDLAVTGVGVGIFAGVAYEILAKPPVTKPLIMAMIASAGLLWSVYQYLFVVYAGRTPGMMAAKIRLCRFDGKTPSRRLRRRRVVAFYLSALSLGMGLMWLFVDVDRLCWHDRLSHTYLANRKS